MFDRVVHAFLDGRVLKLVERLDMPQAWQQAAVVGDLDRKPRPRIEFEQQRTPTDVQHDIRTEVAKARHLVTTRCEQ